MNTNYLGISGVVSHSKENTTQYNELLNKLGSEGMLTHFERFVNEQMLTDFINSVKDSINENLPTTRKVNITITKYYSEQVEVEIDVDNSIVGDDLINFLTETPEQIVDTAIEKAFDEQGKLIQDDIKYEYQDPTNHDGGHL